MHIDIQPLGFVKAVRVQLRMIIGAAKKHASRSPRRILPKRCKG